ncbi:TPA: hypothetical protein ENS27_09910, partial [bacterium]|nr:hypothetical protein [bacterium]
LNGKANGEGETTSPLAGNALSLKIGADSNGANLFKGIIDEVRIYNIALSANDIKQNMSASSLSVDTRQKLASTWGDIKDKI